MIFVTCPECGHRAPAEDFEVSQSGECECPWCRVLFLVNLDDEEDDD